MKVFKRKKGNNVNIDMPNSLYTLILKGLHDDHCLDICHAYMFMKYDEWLI